MNILDTQRNDFWRQPELAFNVNARFINVEKLEIRLLQQWDTQQWWLHH